MCLKAAESPYEAGTKCDSCRHVISQMLVWDAQSAVLYFCCSKQVHAVVLEVTCINNTHLLVFFKLFYKSAMLVFTMLETNVELNLFSFIDWHKRGWVFEMRCWCYAVLVKYFALTTRLHAGHYSSKAWDIAKTWDFNIASNDAVAVSRT